VIDRMSESQRCSGEVTSSAELPVVQFFSRGSDQMSRPIPVSFINKLLRIRNRSWARIRKSARIRTPERKVLRNRRPARKELRSRRPEPRSCHSRSCFA
jgi:hypothetical protein